MPTVFGIGLTLALLVVLIAIVRQRRARTRPQRRIGRTIIGGGSFASGDEGPGYHYFGDDSGGSDGGDGGSSD